MDSSPAVDLQERSASTGAISSLPLVLGAAAFALCISVVDLLTYHVNLPVVYIVPLLLIEQLDKRRILWQTLIVLLILTFTGYFFGSRPPGVAPSPEFAAAKLANRLMAASTLIGATAILHLGIAMREHRRARAAWPHDPDGASYDLVILSIDRILAPLLAGLMALALFAFDAAAQAEYNVAILYLVPLVILARTRSLIMLWVGLPVLILAALVGLWSGPPLADPAHFSMLLLNRILTCVAMVSVALILHPRLRAGTRNGSGVIV